MKIALLIFALVACGEVSDVGVTDRVRAREIDACVLEGGEPVECACRFLAVGTCYVPPQADGMLVCRGGTMTSEGFIECDEVFP